MASLKVACVVLMCMAVMSAPMMVQAVSCNDVSVNLAPCLSYLMQGGDVPESCCSGVRNILGSASTTFDKQTVCKCLQQAANNYGINDEYAQALPARCNVSVPYKISRSTNCDSNQQSYIASSSKGAGSFANFFRGIMRQRML
ncbi:Non-specific lipid-transfer protein [Glycine soja]